MCRAVKHLSLPKIFKSVSKPRCPSMDDDDVRSVAWSTVSQTDQLMFTMLTNPQNVDMTRVPAVRPRDDSEKLDAVEEDDERVEDITERLAADLDFDEDLRGTAGHDSPPHGEPSQPMCGYGGSPYEEPLPLRYEEPMPPPPSHEEPPPMPPYEGEPPRPPYEGEPPRPSHEGESPSQSPHAELPAVPYEDHAGVEHSVHNGRSTPQCDAAEAGYLPFDDAPRSNDPSESRGAALAAPCEPLSAEDETDSKRTVLMDLQALERRGVKLTKNWTLSDSLDDMLLEMRRHTLALDEQSNVSMMRDGLRMVVTGIELVNNRFKFLDLEGWSAEVCQDLEKHDQNLARIYRKYCRRGVNRNPEMEIAMSLVGSLGFHHIKRSMARQMLQRAAPMGDDRRSARAAKVPRRRQPRRAASPSSSDEEPPP